MDSQPQQDAGLRRLMEIRRSLIEALTLQLAAELGICDLLASGSRSVDELGAATSTDPDALHRLLRMLAVSGVCTEVAPGCFGLTATGAYLQEDHPQSVRSMLRLDRLFSHAFTDTMYSLRTGTAAFSRTFGEPFFTYLRNHPDQGVIFDKAMAVISRTENAAVVHAYDFASARTVVDVGGGTGSLLNAILLAFPTTTGVLFDQPLVVEHARDHIAAAKLTDRCHLVSGDFFYDILPTGDVYLMKSIIHNWSDEEASAILRNCCKVMSPGSRLLLVERIIPRGNAPHPSKEMDLAMLVVLGGKERVEDDYVALLDRAGLRLTRVINTESALSLIEAVPAFS